MVDELIFTDVLGDEMASMRQLASGDKDQIQVIGSSLNRDKTGE